MLLVILTLLSICTVAFPGVAHSVIFTSVVFRHGDRTPIRSFPNDQYSASEWPNGFGYLTPIGVKQLNWLGTFIRENYAMNVNKTAYLREEVLVRSTDVDRTLMSAEALLNSLFNGVPVPIHTINKADDHLLFSRSSCPRYDHLFDAVMHSSQADSLRKINKDNFNFIRDHTGLKSVDIEEAVHVFDTLNVERIYDRLPLWANNSTFLHSMKMLKWELLKLRFYSLEMQRLKVGTLLLDISKHMRRAVMKKPSIKLMLYSAHDFNICGLLAAFGAFTVHPPPHYGAAIFVELLMNQLQQYFVKISYLNGSVTDNVEKVNVVPIILPNCDELCPLDTFFNSILPLLPGDITKECSQRATAPFTIFDIFLYTSVLVGFIYITYFCYSHCLLSPKHRGYSIT